MNPSEAKDFENRCIDLLKSAGWEVEVISPRRFFEWLKSEGVEPMDGVYPDLVLSLDKTCCGFADLFVGIPSAQFIRKKLKIAEWMKSMPDKLFFYITTNGESFDFHYQGKLYGGLSNPPSPPMIQNLSEKKAKP